MGVTVKNGKFYFNDKRKEFVLGRSSFKLANIVTYHYTGQGGGRYSLGAARRWIAHNQSIFGTDVVLRVFLETAGWDPQSKGMFGSAPQDQGFWGVRNGEPNRDHLRDGVRTKRMPAVGDRVLEWFFKTSEEMGVAFELVIDATLKHDDIPRGEIDHAIRTVGVRMGELAQQHPRALIIPETRNEWNAHSNTPLADVNMWAERWWRDQYWPSAPLIVSPGGANLPTYKIGGRGYRAAIVHPERGRDWEEVPLHYTKQLQQLANGYPVGYNESMYLVEIEDIERVRDWYRPSGWTANFGLWKEFYLNAKANVDYFIIHDEKGVQCDPEWPRPLTRMERYFANQRDVPPPSDPPVDPPPGNDPPPVDPDNQELASIRARLDVLEEKVERLSGNGPAPIPDTPPLPPVRKPTDYIPWDDRLVWAKQLDLAYSPWRGERDLWHVRDKIEPEIVETMIEVDKRGARLAWRIKNEKHRKYDDRSQVRKSVQQAMRRELEEQTEIYNSIRTRFTRPYDGVGPSYDTIAGYFANQDWKRRNGLPTDN